MRFCVDADGLPWKTWGSDGMMTALGLAHNGDLDHRQDDKQGANTLVVGEQYVGFTQEEIQSPQFHHNMGKARGQPNVSRMP